MAQAAQANITPFIFDHHNVRVVTEEDGPWFVGKDVCVALGLSNHKQALARLNDDERKGVIVVDPLGKNAQRATGVNEPGIYRLVFTSRVDAAERFKRWLAHEVLPAIRKTGSYTSGKTVNVESHTRRTSTKVDDAVRLKTNIDRLESVVANIDADRIQPTQPNFCAMVIDGEHVFVDINDYKVQPGDRAVVVDHAGAISINNVDPEYVGFKPMGPRSALGPRYPTSHGGIARNTVMIVGKVLGGSVRDDRQRVVDDVTERLRIQITTLLDAGPYNDHQIARQLCCNPKLVREVRRVQSRKPTDTPPAKLIEHQPQYRGRRTIYRDEILRLLKTSLTNREIAQRTGATYQTVTHWRRWAADRP